jgi:fructose-1,6-bisphosphatase
MASPCPPFPQSSQSKVSRFQLEPNVGEFVFVENIRFPEGGGKKIYSCNEGNSKHWDKPILDFVEECKGSGTEIQSILEFLEECKGSGRTI